MYTNTVEATPWSIKLDTADPDIYNQKQSEIDKELVNGYKSEISGIKIASAADTMAITAN